MKKIILLLILAFPIIALAQEKKEKKTSTKFYGFVKNDFFVDSRQTVSAREGHFLLFPKPISEDADGNDINSHSSFNFLSIQTRVGVAISGPDVLGAKTSAKVEGDFFAQANDNINLLRLRHAYIKLNWENTELLMGQYWIPMFITDAYPGTVSFNTGSPIQPFGRSPQIRLTHKMGGLKLIAVASSERDYASRGIAGTTGEYLRNSMMPEFNGQVHFSPSKAFVAGIGAAYKQITPEIITGQGYATDQTVGGYNAIAFFKLKTTGITIKMEGIYGQNIPDVLSIGGFAVTDSTDLIKGFVEYSPISTMSAWTDIHTNGKTWQAGVFAGYTKNLGSENDIVGPMYGLGTNIESLYRVSPRLIYKNGPFKLAFEVGYTVANYGSSYDIKGVPTNLTAADNTRFLLATYYSF